MLSSSPSVGAQFSGFGIVIILVAFGTTPTEAAETSESTDASSCVSYVDADARDDADVLTRRGIDCFGAGEYDWALTHYRRAYELDADPFLLGAIGRSLHELGLYEPAKGYYRRFLEDESSPSGAERIERRLDEVEAKLDDNAVTVSLQTAPGEATTHLVLDNGEWYELGATPVELKVREGDYEFVFDRDGYQRRHTDAHITSGRPTEINEPLIDDDATFDISRRNRRRAGIWTSAASLLFGAAGGGLLVYAATEEDAAGALSDDDFDSTDALDDARRSHRDRASTSRLWGSVGTTVGFAGLVTGTVLYLTNRPDDTPAASDDDLDSTEAMLQPTIEPVVGYDHLGLRLRF